MHISGFGALPVERGVRFRLWAPAARSVSLVLLDGRAAGTHLIGIGDDRVYDRIIDGAAAGDRYVYRLDDGERRPDPASRCLPEGVHGPSEVVDPGSFRWSDGSWRGRSPGDLAIYELHVGTFSPEGTFAGATRYFSRLRDLGVTAIELMPVAAAAGSRNWGYDGVALYAPSPAYGHPDELRTLVDTAHHFGLSVILDVVYNHLGPEGAYLPELSADYLTDRHTTPWGHAVNLEEPMVRAFILDNALHWVREYHVDGLRLDATHALIDGAESHIVRDIAAALHAERRPIVVHAEDDRNLALMIEDPPRGWGLDGVWADDFHHVMRRLLADDAHGYYADFAGTTDELARTIRQGWLYTGQQSRHQAAPRGTDASRVPMRRFVVCLQNHDQIGNRARGDRLNHVVSPAAWRAASTVLLTAPMTPLLFMGQEWAASVPFQYFTDLEPGLGRLVTEGRCKEFADFPEFATLEGRGRIPDPQSPATFEASRLRWEERDEPGHGAALRLYQALLSLRLEHRALGASDALEGDAEALDTDTIAVRRADDRHVFWVVARLRNSGDIDLAPLAEARGGGHADPWDIVLTTEDGVYSEESAPIAVDRRPGGPVIRFARPGAVILKQR
jgi:maltooligosyltrehalose trehalohydrolase